jgi:DNA-binding sugar fermentation-stimulating protein
MLAEQGGLCAVCKQPPTQNNTRAHWDGKLCVDHCHDTGRVRGLLCNDCNLAVGYGRIRGKPAGRSRLTYAIEPDEVVEVVPCGL